MLCHVKTFLKFHFVWAIDQTSQKPTYGQVYVMFCRARLSLPIREFKRCHNGGAARTSKKQYRLNTRQNNNSARAARFFVHFSAVTARLRLERERAKTKFSLSL